MKLRGLAAATLFGCVFACGGSEAPQPHAARIAARAAPAAPVASASPPLAEPAPPAAAASASAPVAQAPPPAVPAAPRITSVDYVTWIWPSPKVAEPFLGYVRVGESVALRSSERVRGVGCAGGFYAVEPRGYVCADRTVSDAPDALFVAETAATRAKDGPFPYGYAISNGTPMYARLPSADEQRRFERPYGPAGKHPPLPRFLRSHEELAVEEPIAANGATPPHLLPEAGRPRPLELVKDVIPLGSMLSFTHSFDLDGRTFVLSAEGAVVPADRLRPFRPSTFQGTALGDAVKLPIAWIRRETRPRYVFEAGSMRRVDGGFTRQTFVSLGDRREVVEGRVYLATTALADGGATLFIAEDDATVVRAATKRPAGVAIGQKWVLVSITAGTLVAYQDLEPSYATLISPGAGGVPIPGRDPVKDSTTPTGTYYVTFKDRAATMSPEKGKGRSFWIADVPHTLYFNPPFALHAAYWHERFGEPTSAGCINLSPRDAEVIFDWADPPVPEGWQGATGAGATKHNGPTTAVVVRR